MRLNIEDRFFTDPDVNVATRYNANFDVLRLTGAMAWLWWATQKKGLYRVTAFDILAYSRIEEILTTDDCILRKEVNIPEAEKEFIGMLLRLNFIELVESNEDYKLCIYTIKGNLDQIESTKNNLEKKKIAGKKGAEARWSKDSDDGTCHADAIASASDCDANANATAMAKNGSNTNTNTNTSTNTSTNKNNKIPSSPPASTDLPKTPDEKLATKWITMAKEEAGWREYKFDTFVSGIKKIKKNLNLTDEGVDRVFEFIKQDDFWRPNCLSPPAMFKKSKSNDLRKIDNVLLAFKKQTEKYDKAMKAADDIKNGDYNGW